MLCTHGEVLKRPCVLNVGKGLLEILQLDVNLVSSLLSFRDLLHDSKTNNEYPTHFLTRTHLQP